MCVLSVIRKTSLIKSLNIAKLPLCNSNGANPGRLNIQSTFLNTTHTFPVFEESVMMMEKTSVYLDSNQVSLQLKKKRSIWLGFDKA